MAVWWRCGRGVAVVTSALGNGGTATSALGGGGTMTSALGGGGTATSALGSGGAATLWWYGDVGSAGSRRRRTTTQSRCLTVIRTRTRTCGLEETLEFVV